MSELERVYHALAVLKYWWRGPYGQLEKPVTAHARALINHDRILTQRPLSTY